ncbi:putative C6 finger domain protein [Hypoxylon sp. FL1150]|nr:putative C6 finger domain protein [Hypoxylon sp. FL1150]
MSFNRRRVALACTYCRHKKRRCDASKPRCNNCINADAECLYDDTPSQRIDTSGGTREILSRLGDIEAVLQEQSQHFATFSSISPIVGPPLAVTSPGSHASVSGGSMGGIPRVDSNPQWMFPTIESQSDMDSSEPMNIPPKHKTSSSYLLSLPAIKALIGEYPTDLFFFLESRNPLPPELSLDTSSSHSPLQIDPTLADHLVSSFFSSAHICHPILDREDFRNIYNNLLENGLDSSAESALCLVVLALGAISAAPTAPESSPPGYEYMQRALPTLMSGSLWSFSYNVVLVQALVLASVYFAYIVRPLHSWRLIYSASTILQFKLFNLDSRRHALSSEETTLRLFWSCFLIECDRLAELELPRSSLQQLIDEASLPRYGNLNTVYSTCFLAEISIRRLLNRIHNSLYPRRRNDFTLSSTSLMAPDEFSIEEILSMTSVCDELHRQLDLWHASIPEPCRPPLEPGPLDNDRIAILRIRYFAARHIIYRPFALYVATHSGSSIPSSVIEKAGICIESCRLYLHMTSDILRGSSQYTWTFSLSSLGATIILTLSWLSVELNHFVLDIHELQSLVIDNVRPWAAGSSLADVVSILEEMQRKTRLRSRFDKLVPRSGK